MPELSWTTLADGPPDGEVLVVGPSLGTAVEPLWADCARLLARRYRVIGWDLPGHGQSPASDKPLRVKDLAEAVLDSLPGDGARYAGVSVGGATGLELALLRNRAVAGIAVLCSAAKFGTAQAWKERAELVRAEGIQAVVEGSRLRWFAADTAHGRPGMVEELLDSLRRTDSASYVRVCEALADYDVRDRLTEIDVPVLAIAGAQDEVCPPEKAQEIAGATAHGRTATIDGAAHLAPAEQPQRVADLLLHWDAPEGDRR